MSENAAPVVSDRPWHIVGRWQEFEGEARANLLRVIGIAVFYGVELLNYHGLHLGFLHLPKVEGVDRRFHLAVTALAVAWTMVGLGVQLCLQRQVFPAALKYASTGCDIALMTAILTVADGPKSPLVIGFFLIVVLSALRFSLGLVRFAAAGGIAGYLFLLGHARWFRPELRVPRYHEIVVLLALALTGVVLGQVIRRVRAMAREYVERLGDEARAGHA